ncbi:hypothetical protein EBR37_02675, partial [bacterium]|nr:hypothetical protein [bacterium]
SGYKDRAIQKAISELEDVGHLSREERSGTTPIYTLHIMHPRTTCTPPPHVVHPNLNRTINKNKMQIDWQPTTEMIEFAHEFIGGSIEDTARRIQDEADRFRDYWIGTGKPMADWSATWRNWIRRSKSIQGSRSSSQSNLSSRVAEGNRARVSGLLDSIYKHEEKFTNQYGSEDGTPRLIKS